ncbi:hypothetical protein CGZ90_19495 [Fictibacillus aquaticus]|uniref:Uncharacterized protein n=2 Tax=Fictibacillus aquaticus TaxID=2021314 RepID=A0A235F4B1_9BACL|nr:hypothetical protein CGZ90_19495 [Fictibacillus aquaticus]
MRTYVISGLVLSFLLAGCQQKAADPSLGNHSMKQTSKDMEYQIGSNKWPELIKQNATDEVMEAYQFALDKPEVLNNMPCYCGCFEEDGHTSNTNCFVESVDGNIAMLDDMGLG